MKVQCDLCREIVVAELAIRGDRIEVHCPSCDGRFDVATAGKAPSLAPVKFAPPAPEAIDGDSMTCPKCGLVQRPADACRACGLRADKMASFTATDVAAAPEVGAAWLACERAWSEPAAHEEVARVAAAFGAYAWLARRYRDRLRGYPDDAVAAARLAAVTRMAEAALRAGATAQRDGGPGAPGAAAHKPYKSATAILVMLVLLAAAGTIYALVSTPTDEAPAEPIPVKPLR